MTDKRLHPAEQAGRPLGKRIRELVGYAEPPLRRPRAPRIHAVRRSSLGALWQARVAVRAGMTLDDFLRSRLGRYVAALPASPEHLRPEIAIDDGRIAVQAPPPPAGAGEDDWLLPLVHADGPPAREEANRLDVQLALLDGEIEAARRRVDELSRRFGADVASGLVSAPPAVEATAEQLGRPPVRSSTPRVALLAFAAATLLAHTWRIAIPLLHGAGLDPATLRAALSQRPGEVIAALVFALGASAALFALVHASLGAAIALAGDVPERRRRRFLAGAAVGAAALAAIVATAVAALPQVAGDAGPERASLALLLLAIPVGAAFALRAARRHEEARAAEEQAALDWDRERARGLAERARRLEEIEWAETEERTLERQRELTRRRLRELSARAVQAAAIAREAREAEQAAVARLAQGLVGALELDRYEFLRQAVARDALELAAPRRRKAVEVRAALFDAPITATPAEVEPGRLAS